ncbi:MAG: cob(I)yrinic acid a,c-diamide adenosyltransferase [Candidatus Dactylopiibacterium carminicum]|uniref:Corrinoid adenosyltransferase n=1 Tax=Candidatus Dactylopiibacterium carminicum TaxID=857335 RepID=A0A272EZ71_9RHOO|nr:cob(I)yrinic acid a,c-diamide adenosyltransferase [Candidatus Dactylopiibacterium carminicum]KAF7600896.1 cob(I)yrinic acid a,c-diamide adenosyltransferase [Candidatus Dactylopiibacterium carminicum]PAS95411.1 MAG: cob(I)yrinic acid a,c-diamide adenosyltransferase [Candidatus Dactylopiibacterium carminicum]PAS98730.1 MAG: cob(I)yrinic acid a,c-diamide adenosyltransferase [Candidatus Dactylopiibacterium carminicum]PAT00894.1 MAG: cob(I)yrinic acid a,c-diamide adenosyltransferase [Candidatus D
MQDADREARHQARMARKKAIIDAHIAAADEERGLLLINTGNGKGKSSAAFGVLARALGHGMNCAVIQFIKSRSDTGEEAFFRDHPRVKWHVMGDGFTWDTQNDAQDRATARTAWEQAVGYLRDPAIDLLILDEFTYTLKYGWLPLEKVSRELMSRPEMQHVIITGRAAPEGLIEIADTVTTMDLTRHAYHAGVKAMPGIEW